MLAAIAFDNNIRGMLVILVASVVLIGSIYMLLATNTGLRAGFLIAGAGLFGWLFLMGGVWWMYGIGLKGRDPAWIPLEINYNRASPVDTKVVDSLPTPEALPDPAELMAKYPLLYSLMKASEGKDYTPSSLSKVVTLDTPLVELKKADLESTVRKNLKANSQEYLSGHPEAAAILDGPEDAAIKEINSQARTLRTEIESHLGGWCLLSESDSRRGEAAASSDAALAAAKAFGDTTAPADYTVSNVFFLGGKEPCTPITELSSIQQAWHRIHTTFELKNPKLYSVVIVTRNKVVVTAPGETPAPASIQPGAKSVSVVQMRNLGNKRFIPFVFMLVNGILFAVFAITLHTRDKAAMAARAAFAAEQK